MCDRVWRAGVGRREVTVQQNHSSAGQGMFFGLEVFNFPFLYWTGHDRTLAVMWAHPGWPSTTTEGGDGCGSQHCRASSTERGGHVARESPFLSNTGQPGPPQGANISFLGQLRPLQSLQGLPPILKCEC